MAFNPSTFDSTRLTDDQYFRLKPFVDAGANFSDLPEDFQEEILNTQDMDYGLFDAGIDNIIANMQTSLAGTPLVSDSFAKDLIDSADERLESSARRRPQKEVDSIIDSFSEKGFLGGIADLKDYAPETIKEGFPSFALPIATGLAGSAALAPVGLSPLGFVGGTVLGGLSQLYGGNIRAQMEEQDIPFEEVDKGKAGIVSIFQVAPELALNKFLLGAGTPFLRAQRSIEALDYAKKGINQYGSRALKGFAGGASLEGIAEGFQNYLEIVQSRPDFDLTDIDSEDFKIIAESAIAGGLLGGTAGATLRPFFDPEKSQIEKLNKEKQEDLDLDRKERIEKVKERTKLIDQYVKDREVVASEIETEGFTEDTVEEIEKQVQEYNNINQANIKERSIDRAREVKDENEKSSFQLYEEESELSENFKNPQLVDEKIANARSLVEGVEDKLITDEIKKIPDLRGDKEKLLERFDKAFQKDQYTKNIILTDLVTDPDQVINLGMDNLESQESLSKGKTDLNPKRYKSAYETMGYAISKIIVDGQPRYITSVDNPDLGRQFYFTDDSTNKVFDLNNKEIEDGLAKSRGMYDSRKELLGALQDHLKNKKNQGMFSSIAPQQENLILATQKSINDTKDFTRTAEFDSKVERVESQLKDKLKKLKLGDIKLTGLEKDGSKEGYYSNQVIALASRIYNPNLSEKELLAEMGAVMDHEIIHAVKDMGLITEPEFKTLVTAAKNQNYVDDNGKTRKFTYFDRAKDIYGDKPITNEEAVAELFRGYASGRKKIVAKPRTIFERIKDFIIDLGGILNKENLKASNIFDSILSGEIGSRYRKNTGDMFSELLPEGMESSLLSGSPTSFTLTKADEDNLNKIKKEVPGFRSIAKYLKADELNLKLLTKSRAKNIVEIFNELPSSKEMAAVAYSGRGHKGWYERSANALRGLFGDDAPRFAALLASLSPQTSVEDNLFNTLNVWNAWTKAGRPTETKDIIDILANNVQGDKGEESVLGAWRNNSLTALQTPDFDNLFLSGPKVDSFMRNLIGFYDEVTSDTWMANYSGMDQGVFAGSSKLPFSGKDAGYLAMSAKVRKAAEISENYTGEKFNPAQIQETVWSWSKALLEDSEKKGEIRSPLQILQDGDLTHAMVGEIPDFSKLLKIPRYLSIIDDMGLRNNLDNLSVTEKEQLSGSVYNVPDKLKTDLNRAAKVLSKLKQQRLFDKTKTNIVLNISTATPSIPGLKSLQENANQGDKEAEILLQSVAIDSMKYLTRAIKSANVTFDRAVGMYGGDYEPSIGVNVEFRQKDTAPVLAAVAQFAENFNQEQAHVRSDSQNNRKVFVYPDNSYNTTVYRFDLKEPLTRSEIEEVVEKSGLFGFTATDTYLEAYYFNLDGDPKNDTRGVDEFIKGATRARGLLRGKTTGIDIRVERLRAYGNGAGATAPYGSIKGKLPAKAKEELANPSAQRIATYIAGREIKPAQMVDEVSQSQKILQREIANSYIEMGDNELGNPIVRKSYNELSNEILDQYLAMPIKVEVFKGKGEPYKNSKAMRDDILKNNRLKILATSIDDFGPKGVIYENHPLLLFSGQTDINGQPLLYNDLLRAVHDFYAHTMSIANFAPRGEETAWMNHMLMTKSPWARWALTSETRAQNSFVNYSPGRESLSIKDRDFAPQKVDLLPLKYVMTGDPQTDASLRQLPGSERLPLSDAGTLEEDVVDAVVADTISSRFKRAEETDPELRETPDDGRYSSLTAELENTIAKVVGEEKSGLDYLNDKVKKLVFGGTDRESYKEAFVRNVVNRFLPGFQLDALAYGELSDDMLHKSVGRNMELSQQLAGRTQALVELGALEIDPETGAVTVIDRPDNIGILEIFAPIGEKFKKQFQTYAVFRRERELRNNDRQGFFNISDKEIEDGLAELNEKHPDFAEVFDNYQKFNSDMIKLARDAQVIDPDFADQISNMSYVPFYRALESSEINPDEQATAGLDVGSLNSNAKVFKTKLKGGEIPLGDFYENIIKNNQAILSSALRNIALARTVDALEVMNERGDTSWGEKITNPLQRSGGNILKLRKNEINPKTGRMENKVEEWKVNDPALWITVANLRPKQLNTIIRFMAMFSNILRSGVTLQPAFMLANLWRGKIDAYVKAGSDLSIAKTASGVLDAYGGKEATATKIRTLTGMGGYTYGMGERDFADVISQKYRVKQGQGNKFLKTYDLLRLGVRELEKLGESTEMAERTVYFKKLVSEGVPEKEAAYQAMNLINFGRRGAAGGYLGSAVDGLIPMIPFLNARIQGLYRLIEDPKTPGDVKLRLTRGIMLRGSMLTAISLGLYALFGEDDRWDEETLDRKVNYDILYFGDNTFYIPKAFEIGSLFQSIPVLILDDLLTDKKDLAPGVKSILLNTFAFDPIPQGALPLIEVGTGFDRFTGRPIEGVSLQRNAPHERFYDSTPEAYKAVSKGLAEAKDFVGLSTDTGLSPLELKQIFEGYTGSMGASLVSIIDTIVSYAGSVPDRPSGFFGDPNKPVGLIANTLGIQRFFRDDSERISRFVTDFYDVKRGIEFSYNSIKNAALKNDREEIDRILERKGVALSYRKQFNRVANQLTKINKAIQNVIQDPNMSSDAKQKRLTDLKRIKFNLTRQVLKASKKAGL
tara:strand:- start:4111 stop:11997 length:7887 start_codon:yes stop_codon:yes gene_type:complete